MFGSPEPQPAALSKRSEIPQTAEHQLGTDIHQLQTTLTDKESELADVKQRADQLSIQVAELQSNAEKSSHLLQIAQQSSSAAALRSSELEQQLLLSQASFKQLQEQLAATDQASQEQIVSLQGNQATLSNCLLTAGRQCTAPPRIKPPHLLLFCRYFGCQDC